MEDSNNITYEPIEETIHVLTEKQAEQLAHAYYQMGERIFEILADAEYPFWLVKKD